MENILLIGHGSPKKDANNIDLIGRLLHDKIHSCCGNDCVKVAYLQFAEPDIMEAIRDCVGNGAERIIMHPYFLSSGMHVTKDIPAVIKEAEEMYPNVEFIYTEPLGIHDNLVQIVMERIDGSMQGRLSTSKGSLNNSMVTREEQHPIEKRSFEIISEELDLSDVQEERLPLIKRVIHSTADFEFKKTLRFHPDAIRAGINAIRAGKDILTDVEMVKSGINKRLLRRWGGKVICKISDKEVVRESKETGKTRAEISMMKGINDNVGVIAIGNAPTALFKAIEVLAKKSRTRTKKPLPLVVGVPVGFVDAAESKDLLASQKFPFITNLGRKGGTPVAVAIVNALLIMAQEEVINR